MNRPPLRRGLLIIPLALACFVLLPMAQAQLPSPAPDGGYPGSNTAEGDGALYNDDTTNGVNNTATGFDALFSNTTGLGNTATGNEALESNTTGGANTATGHEALLQNTTGIDNTATGVVTLFHNTTGDSNTATGAGALFYNTTGGRNAATGGSALTSNTTGNFNTATGNQALLNNSTGSNNIALGYQAGFNLNTGDNNIDIGNQGVAAEANTIRIGTQGTQTATYVAGISGGAVAGVAVKVNAAGQVGTAPSSARFKDEIKPMNKASETILALKPVSFRYKKEIDPDRSPQFGLVAEDVEKVDPALVARDADGKPYTVRYDAVNAMLLNEFLKEHKAFLEEHRTVQNQQKEIDALKAELKEQKAFIQKVSAQVEASRPAPQMVLNQ